VTIVFGARSKRDDRGFSNVFFIVSWLIIQMISGGQKKSSKTIHSQGGL